MEEKKEPIPFEETIGICKIENLEQARDIFENTILKENSVEKEKGEKEENEDVRSDSTVKETNDKRLKWLMELFEILPLPITVVYEPYYVDRIYRDEYYCYYSSKHFDISRNCKRVILFAGKYEKLDFLSNDLKFHKKIQDNMIGAIVLKPTKTIGRTLINPHKLNISKCYVRTTEFEVSVYGRMFKLEAFPFSGQDSEVMTCAEVNVWQIMEYFGSRYKDYKTMLPSEMIELLKKSSEVRILPSEGLSVEQEAFLFTQNGLATKIYNKYDWYEESGLVKVNQTYDNPSFNEIMHFYVESGIPILVNLRDKHNPQGENHSITLIGHGEADFKMMKNQEAMVLTQKLKSSFDSEEECEYNICILKSWEGFDNYVIMEDHSVPYRVLNLKDLKFSDDGIEWEIESFVVPLYKHIFMPAEEAYKLVENLLHMTSKNIINTINKFDTSEESQVVIRLFLTTSRAYKEFRICETDCVNEKGYYSQVDYPKFLWVCEYGTIQSYNDGKAIGEFVIDATASSLSAIQSVISIRNSKEVSYRSVEESIENAFVYRNMFLDEQFSMFVHNNLKIIEEKGGNNNGNI